MRKGTNSDSSESSGVNLGLGELKMSKQDQIEALRKKEAQIKAKLAELEKQAGAEKRKEDTRLKVLIGAAMLADIDAQEALNPETAARHKEAIKAILDRAIKSPRDREFLVGKRWLKPLPKT
jgi:hypothetical protein